MRLTRRGRVVLIGVPVFAVCAIAAVVAYALLKEPDDVSNPDAPFTPAEQQETFETVDWPLYGLDSQRTRYLPSGRVKPPYRVKWRYKAQALMEYSPIVVKKSLYGINNNGKAFAVNINTGLARWKRDVASLNASAPAYADGVLYLSNLDPGQVVALDADNGEMLWRHEMPGRTESSPVVVGNKVIMGCECGSLFALNRRNGKVIWETEVGGEVKAAPAFENGILYIGAYGGNVAAVRASDGSVKWRADALSSTLGSVGNFYATPTVAFGRVYIGNTDGRMYSFLKKTGELAWTKSTGDYVYAAAAAADTKNTSASIYFGSYDGTFYALNARSGEVRWEKPAGGGVSGAASVIGETVYVANLAKTRTIGFNVKNGRRAFTFKDGAYNPVISNGRVLFLTGYKHIYAMKPTDEPESKSGVYGVRLKQGRSGGGQ